MEVGVALEMFEMADGRTVPLDDLAQQARKAEQLGYSSAWVMDHFWVEGSHGRRGGHDPMVVLGYLAARTEKIKLGTLVACNSWRHPGQLAREAAALADAAPGRFLLGLGAGWHQPEYQAFGLPFDHRVSRLEETLAALRPLLSGRPVDLEGRWLRLKQAQVLTTAAAPPIWVAGAGPRTLALAAEHADGWNVAWLGPDPGSYARLAAEIKDRLRGRDSFTFSVGLLALPVEGSELDTALELAARLPSSRWNPSRAHEQAVLGGPQRLAQALRDYEAVGADHVILNFAPGPFGRFDASYVERAAPALAIR